MRIILLSRYHQQAGRETHIGGGVVGGFSAVEFCLSVVGGFEQGRGGR